MTDNYRNHDIQVCLIRNTNSPNKAMNVTFGADGGTCASITNYHDWSTIRDDLHLISCAAKWLREVNATVREPSSTKEEDDE